MEAANNNNNNNNNNNIGNPAKEDKYGIPYNIDSIIRPTIVSQAKISRIYATLRSYIRIKTTSLEMVQTFLKQYILALFVTEGYNFAKWDEIKMEDGSKDLVRHLTVDKCTFLGTVASGSSGCKLTSAPEKLTSYVHIMIRILLAFFTNLSEVLREQMLLDNETMELFKSAIQNLLYFYGQKKTGAILGGKDNEFIVFFDKLNTLFDFPVLQIGCEKETYGCGRFLVLAMCDTSKKHYIFIYTTKGESNQGASNNYGNKVLNKSKTCGGRRKRTRKQKHKRKQTMKN